MAYDLDRDETTVLAGYKPKEYRTKTISVKGSNAGNMNAAMELGLDVSTALEIDRVANQLVIVWANLNEGYYENMGNLSSGSVDYFGVLYDLPDFTNRLELPFRENSTVRIKISCLLSITTVLSSYNLVFMSFCSDIPLDSQK